MSKNHQQNISTIDARDHFGNLLKVDVFKIQKVLIEEKETGYFLMIKVPEGFLFPVDCLEFDYYRYNEMWLAKENKTFYESLINSLKIGITQKKFRKELRQLIVRNKPKNRTEWDVRNKEIQDLIIMMDTKIIKNNILINKAEKINAKRLMKIGVF